MQTCPKISSTTEFAENPLAGVDLISLHLAHIALDMEISDRLCTPNTLHCLQALKLCATVQYAVSSAHEDDTHIQGPVCMCTSHRTEVGRCSLFEVNPQMK